MRLTRCWASGSTQSGSILALTRAQRREVSTSSADMIHCGCFLASAEPGKMAKRALRAPRYSWMGRRPSAPRFSMTSLTPMCDSSPTSSDTCTW
ncbi:hypothetical protein BKM31_58700 [[Actinomadura] parvosata subsp. kistnae]|uniref:Uncharacterized protein n=1 Tax=[Actinomadura] parvosata subsp. kistnae TaxID=1909395 RepID=A0A1V0AIG8_9ACTN|nr:hypothetical protein BKM31_58700 [Nonomuraea sp. ATCC 55076]